MTRSRRMRALCSLLLPHGALAACGALLVWHSLQYHFITDDAYISFVYARNLAEHGALVFNPGDPVEGYTNFLWTFLLGVLMWLGLSPEMTSLVLGTGFGLGTLAVAYALAAHALGDDEQARGRAWALMAPALLALSAGFACWSSGGLETQMFTFWVALALFAYVRGDREARWLRRAGVFLALAAMTRPEGLLITAVIGAHRLAVNLIRERRLLPSRDELLCLGSFLLLWAPWYAWRWWYYGHPFPNTYYVKAAGDPPPGYTARLLDNGLYYVGQWARQTRVVYAAPLLLMGLVWARPGSRRLLLGTVILPLGVLYLAYTIKVGGDFMGLHRFIMPVFVLAAVAVALGLHRVATLIGPGRRRLIAPAAAVALIAAFAVSQLALTRESLRWGNFQSDRGIDTPAFLRAYTLDRAAIGAHMRDCFTADDFSIVGGAGAQPYHGRMRGIDVFGLVSSEIAHTVPPTNPRAGHNKWAPNELLLRYQPTFVFSCYAIHTQPDNPRFNCAPGWWLARGYERVTLHIPALTQQGQYYSFFKRADRELSCPGIVTP